MAVKKNWIVYAELDFNETKIRVLRDDGIGEDSNNWHYYKLTDKRGEQLRSRAMAGNGPQDGILGLYF